MRSGVKVWSTGVTSWAMIGPSSSSAVTKCAVAPISFTPRPKACRYGLAPAKAGRNEWWMFTIPFGRRSMNFSDNTRM